MHRAKALLVGLFLAFSLLALGCTTPVAEAPAPQAPPAAQAPPTSTPAPQPDASPTPQPSVDLASIPPYAGTPYVEINGGIPSFSAEDLARASFEEYAPLDNLGRCGAAFALVGPETMPTEKRGSIGAVKPSGWHLVKYDIVDGKYLFNRCHLIAYRLTGENANERNLITGTRYLNTEGMSPHESAVADYIEATKNHVLMRVTPLFEGEELVARGVQLEAHSIEDDGAGISYNVYAYNVQPGITINYATGESALDGTVEADRPLDATQYAYVLNTGAKRFHLSSCPSVDDMNEKNKQGFNGTRDEALAQGYQPCGRCKP